MAATSGFAVPSFALGGGNRFTISASDVATRHSAFTCPMGLSLKARVRAGSLRPDGPGGKPRFDRAGALNLAVQRGLSRLVDGSTVKQIIDGDRDLTHSQRRFLRHALDVLPDLLPEAGRAAGVAYRLAPEIIGRVRAGDLRGTVTVWALHLQGLGSGGPVHEAVRLRLPLLAAPTEEDADWVAVAAVALATDDDVPAGARLRISEFSVLDGGLRCAFDGSRAEAIRLLGDRGRPLSEALEGTAFRPGSACAGCAFLRVCPAVPSRPGLLGVPLGVATRRLTAADLASYQRCPTAFRALRADHLPPRHAQDADPGNASAAVQRGLAVHAWLAWAHGRDPARPCAPEDLPDPGTPPAAHAAAMSGLDADAYAVAHPFLAQHPPHCLAGHPDLGGWSAEQPVVVHDPQADAVVISTPDLACRVAGTGDPVWRETKTSGTIPPDLPAALRRYPDVALNIVLLADRAERQGGVAHAELEVLTPSDAAVFSATTDDGDIVAVARTLVSDVARDFVTDRHFDRRPSGACGTCAAHGWCDPPDDAGRLASAAAIRAIAAIGDGAAGEPPF